MGVTVEKMAADLGLRNLTPDIDADEIEIRAADVSRPGLHLAGYFEFFEPNRVQLIGTAEHTYAASMTPELRRERFGKIFSLGIPCLVYCRGNLPEPEVLDAAREYGVPIYYTEGFTSEMLAKILHYCQKALSPTLTVHGVLCDVFGEGVLITGESGIGKSETALELIKRGHRLVADDAVEIRRVDEDTLIGTAPDITKDFVELRGIGIVNVKTLFGVESIKNEQQIDLVIRLEEWDREKQFDRLGNADEYVEYLGNKVLCYALPLRPGRNLAVIVETVAANYRQRTMGYQAVDELYKRIQENMIRNR